MRGLFTGLTAAAFLAIGCTELDPPGQAPAGGNAAGGTAGSASPEGGATGAPAGGAGVPGGAATAAGHAGSGSGGSGPAAGSEMTVRGGGRPDVSVDGRPPEMKLTVSSDKLELRPGGIENIGISVDRNTGFNATVELTATAPAGIRALPEMQVLSADAIPLNIFVDKKAVPGEYDVTVTAKPQQGEVAPQTLTIRVVVTR